MIPFDVNPFLYYPFIASIIGGIVMFILALLVVEKSATHAGELCMCLAIFFFVAGGICCLFFVSGSVYTDTITICKHSENNGYTMSIIDTNDNIYYITDTLTKFKVEDNKTFNVKVEELFGSKTIYSIDSLITCNNQKCGATS